MSAPLLVGHAGVHVQRCWSKAVDTARCAESKIGVGFEVFERLQKSFCYLELSGRHGDLVVYAGVMTGAFESSPKSLVVVPSHASNFRSRSKSEYICNRKNHYRPDTGGDFLDSSFFRGEGTRVEHRERT